MTGEFVWDVGCVLWMRLVGGVCGGLVMVVGSIEGRSIYGSMK